VAGSHFLPCNRARSRGLQPAFGFQTDTLPRQPVLHATQHLGLRSRAIMNHGDAADKLRQSFLKLRYPNRKGPEAVSRGLRWLRVLSTFDDDSVSLSITTLLAVPRSSICTFSRQIPRRMASDASQVTRCRECSAYLRASTPAVRRRSPRNRQRYLQP
jgi:hypothetical protein